MLYNFLDTAYCKNPIDDKWYHCDDSSVTECKMEDIVSPAAYLLFYKRRNHNKNGEHNFEDILEIFKQTQEVSDKQKKLELKLEAEKLRQLHNRSSYSLNNYGSGESALHATSINASSDGASLECVKSLPLYNSRAEDSAKYPSEINGLCSHNSPTDIIHGSNLPTYPQHPETLYPHQSMPQDNQVTDSAYNPCELNSFENSPGNVFGED